MKQLLSAIVLVCLTVTVLRADVVYLKNGGKMEGIIVKETATKVVLKISFGEMDIERSEIRKIVRSGGRDRAKLKSEWKKRRVAESRNVPKAKGFGKPGQRIIITLEKSDRILRNSNIPHANRGRIPNRAKVSVYFPKRYTADKRWPLFIANRPNKGNGLDAVLDYRGPADKVGFICASPGLPSSRDNEDARYFYILHAIEYLSDRKVTRGQPVWIGGHSGGGKWAMHLGSYGGTEVFDAVLAMSVNQDFSTIGYREYKRASALHLPIYILLGLGDPIAPAKGKSCQRMLMSMAKTGFRRVYTSEYKGDHNVPAADMLRAFRKLKNR